MVQQLHPNEKAPFLEAELLFTSTMRSLLSMLIFTVLALGCTATRKMEYSIDKEKIGNYRKHPITNPQLIDVIQNNVEFINLSSNSDISEATLEHHLIDQFSNNSITTYIVFEYFSLEGVSCALKAVSIDNNNNLLSIFRLANYVEFPDAKLNESTSIVKNFAERTQVVTGLKEYNDSLNQIIMKIDSTIMTFELNDFKQIKVVDSAFIHREYVEYLD